MVPKKRRPVASLRNPRAKRAKEYRHAPAHQSSAVSGDATPTSDSSAPRLDTLAITARNAHESPLLRLPGELRNLIWELAFGRRTVHPVSMSRHASYMTRPSSPWTSYTPRSCRVAYALCQRPKSVQIEWQRVPIIEDDEDPCNHHTCYPMLQTLGTLVPSVCRQLRKEAVPIAWKSTMFYFLASGDLQDFLQDPGVRLDLVHAISIQITGEPRGETYEVKAWRRAYRSTQMAKLTSLHGLNLILQYYRSLLHESTLKLDIMNSPPREFPDLPCLIRLFQTFPLDENQTTVNVTSMSTFGPSSPGAQLSDEPALAETVRRLLLQKRARKLPKWAEPTQHTRRSGTTRSGK